MHLLRLLFLILTTPKSTRSKIFYMKHLIKFFAIAILILLTSDFSLMAQRGRGMRQRNDAPTETFRWRSIGPGNMMGRISALDAINNDHKTALVGAASGGVWLTYNGGITWTPIFDDYGSASIGDVAFFQPDPSIIWVGTGEANNRNSSAWGDGVYKSVDGGKSFVNVGLKETHQIARIVTHPSNSDILYVAAVGHLWGYSGDRGLYRTKDGGETWEELTNGLPDNKMTGCTEIAMDPSNPDILYAGMYHRIRTPWSMYSGSTDGGMFKSSDGGDSWTKMTNGLPEGETGRIGISIHRANPDIIVACVEASQDLPDDMSVPGPGVYRSDDAGKSWKYLYRHISRPMYHGRIEINPIDDNLIYMIARQYAFSSDGGKTFGRKPWGGAGGDDHDLWLSPVDKDVFYTGTDQGAHLTEDGGKSFRNFTNMAIGQYYAIGTDMRDPYWIYGGLQDNSNWGTPSNTRDRRGILSHHNIEIAGGDGFHNQVDPTDWRTVYTVCHVGGIGRINMETREHKFISPTPSTISNFADYDDPGYEETLVDYTIDPGEGWLWRDIPNRLIKGSALPPHFRYNWSSPLVLSPNSPQTVYVGGNHLFKSTDRGDTWTIISPDLSTNDPAKRNSTNTGGLTVEVTGAENHCTIITIAESHLNESVIWVGTDDGNVQITRDGGSSWTNVRPNLSGVPENTWVSRVESSHFDEGRAFVTFDAHRNDDNTAYVYMTDDFGKSWKNISDGIPMGNAVYVIREDNINPDLLFIGTELTCFVSTNRGESWERFMNNMPTVAFHDLVIHPRDGDLIAGTHGRSLWILDDITPLQQLNNEIRAKDVHMFKNRVATSWIDQTMGKDQSSFLLRGENAPRGASISFYLKEKPSGKITLTIQDEEGQNKKVSSFEAKQGINRIRWNMQFPVRDETIEEFKGTMSAAVREISKLVKTDKEKALIAEIGKELKAASTQRLNNIYVKLTFNFGQYSKGDNFFGKQLNRSVKAVPGTYIVTLEVNGSEYKETVTIRQDPLLSGK